MKTIFIPIFQGVEAKNILRTGIFRGLIARPDLRIVFFVGSAEKAAYYQKEFKNERVIYEVVGKFQPPRYDGVFEYLKYRLLCNQTIDLRRRRALESGGSFFGYLVSFLMTRLFGHSIFRRLARWLDFKIIKDSFFADYFDRYQPQAVFLAHLFGDIEVSMLREARQRGVCSVGMVNSWDKLTGRAIMRLLPDKLIVFNEIMKDEAICYAEMRPADIWVTGVPQFDYYAVDKPSSRAVFCKKIGIDPKKKIIVYSPLGKSNSASDWDIIDMLQAWIDSGAIKGGTALLVRFPPNDFVDEAELKKRPGLHYDLPGVRFGNVRGFGLDWDMTAQDLRHLLDTLAQADLFVSYASTLVIDAAIFDKPVININFEVKSNQPISLRPTSFYVTDHYQKAMRTSGIRMTGTRDELLNWINNYLGDTSLDRAGRQRLVQEQCGTVDGKAGERIAQKIISLL